MRARPVLSAVLASVLSAVGVSAAHAGLNPPGTAGARTVTGVTEASRPAFYEPPAAITGTPGTVIRSESATSLLDPLGVSSLVADARRIMYVSRDRTGAPIVVTGIVVVPRAPWLGLTSRPVISYAPGTQGMADRCAPTRQLAEGIEYESLGIGPLITRGYAVALTDYQGLGTPGSHTYVNRIDEAHAVLDMARAATRAGMGLRADAPVGIMGYSQGGGAAAAAAELAPTYAPEVRLKGVLAGAVPADLAATGRNLDGSPYFAFLAYAVIGMAAGYDVNPSIALNSNGLAMARQAEGSCVTDLTSFAFKKSADYTLDGRSLPDYFADEPWKSILADNLIGNSAPKVPVLIDHSALDDVVPYAVGKTLAQRWCAKGVNVDFETTAVPTHVGGMVPHVAFSLPFFEARFAGLPQLSNCALL